MTCARIVCSFELEPNVRSCNHYVPVQYFGSRLEWLYHWFIVSLI